MKTTADNLADAIALLHKQAPRIDELEKSEKPTDVALLKAFGRLARICAKQKGIAIAPIETPSEIVHKLVNPIQALGLKPRMTLPWIHDDLKKG